MEKNPNFIDGEIDTVENRKFIVKKISKAF